MTLSTSISSFERQNGSFVRTISPDSSLFISRTSLTNSSKNPDEIDINFNNISKYGESFYGEYGENPKYTIKAVSDIGNVKIEYR